MAYANSGSPDQPSDPKSLFRAFSMTFGINLLVDSKQVTLHIGMLILDQYLHIFIVNALKFGIRKFLIKWYMQTVQIQIRLLLKEKSDQSLHCLQFHKKQPLDEKHMK